jgi:hypothetical protein
MDLNQQKEQFSAAYLRAVAAAAGYTLYRPEVDDDSIDWGLAARGAGGTPRRPRLELQLKCSARTLPKEETIGFTIKLKNYEDLRAENVMVPRILVVVLVPEAVRQWLRHSEEELALRHCGYWMSLRGMAPTSNKRNVTVHLPRTQCLTPEVLKQIMQRINDTGAV